MEFVLGLLYAVSGVLVVPFLTLLERKVLSYMQNRKGPNKVSLIGLLQPVADGVKLMIKGSGKPYLAPSAFYYLAPSAKIIIMLLLWLTLPASFSFYYVSLAVLFILCLSSIKVYTLIMSGWSSNSKYSLLGSIRGAAQTMSYEVKMVMLILMPCCLYHFYSLSNFSGPKVLYWLMLSPVVGMWLFTIVAETKRAPFDFAEGESELVSGFNTEYSSLPFALLFMAEYGSMVYFSFMTAVLFMATGLGYFFLCLASLVIMNVFLWARASFPRYRYDLLMSLSWEVLLPTTLLFLFSVL